MKNVAVLGFGTVGSGVVEVICENDFTQKAGESINVKAILEIREFPDSPYNKLIVNDYEKILNDTKIDIVVETMGGVNPAYNFTKMALERGKSVVTSNKELVSVHGAELLRIAKENGVNYLFEASVGGGIPIIRPISNCLAANEITEIMGILNGTTNYILTKMIKNGESFEDALADAQAKGYAERNPAADVEGHDTCRKIAILSALAYGKHIDSTDIKTEGITKITLKDVEYAESFDHVIKLIGASKKVGDKVYAKVGPLMLPRGHALSEVDGVFNAILVKGSATGDVMFYGKGAGKMPTASAVVADVIDIVKHKGTGAPFWDEGGELVEDSGDDIKLYIRLKATDKQHTESSVDAVFGKVKRIESSNDETVFITSASPEAELNSSIAKLKGLISEDNILSVIQVLN